MKRSNNCSIILRFHGAKRRMKLICWCSGITFQAWKRSYIGSGFVEVGQSVIFTNSFFKIQIVQILTVSKCKGVYLSIVRHGIFSSRIFHLIAVSSCKRVDLLMCTNSGFSVRNVEICAVLSWNKVDLLMFRNSVFKQRNHQKCTVLSLKDFDLLKLRNRVLRLENVHILVVPPCLCGRFVHSQESCFQASERSNMGIAVLKVGRSGDFHEFCFHTENVQIWTLSTCKGVYLLIVMNCISGLENFR